MKLFLGLISLACWAAFVIATAPQKAVIVSFPNDTPSSVLDQAKDVIRTAGGIITHEYKLIKAFAAKAPADALDTIQTLDTKYDAVIEEDRIVGINSGA
ncbi:hypothetical protein K431DRAFT_222913 [Polychaeton citri CBS 116435]|uniref:Inhibitor I9 domain-containing protein n=1 Tax=Polychaeton citri CBS 116435 TaxID=1314669 RepID=A0A9P4QBU8_9PEZI|nr:hypothetical protein K431DRAFT_222913 [Polychaeton citri CBS 116435]